MFRVNVLILTSGTHQIAAAHNLPPFRHYPSDLSDPERYPAGAPGALRHRAVRHTPRAPRASHPRCLCSIITN